MPSGLDVLDHETIAAWLRERDPAALERLWARADAVRAAHVGGAVHLRGLIEISNHCVRHCLYCGIRACASVGQASRLRQRYGGPPKPRAEAASLPGPSPGAVGQASRLPDAVDAVGQASVGQASRLPDAVDAVGQASVGQASRLPDTLVRYRLSAAEILACARTATSLGYGTVVMQSGEDPGLTREFIADVIRAIKAETGLAITLSLGEREDDDLRAWKEEGADRFLLRFETSDPELYRRIHPSLPGALSDRVAQLLRMRVMGYEIGTGVMVGIPGQTWDILARDIELFRELDIDMIGIGPFLPSPRTPLGGEAAERLRAGDVEQVPNDELTTLKAVALARIVCPEANIPSTTALATLDPATGRELGLVRGANIVMPNLTPPAYRALYEIYPGKAGIHETAQPCIESRVRSIGRVVGKGPGGRRRGLLSPDVVSA